MNDDSIVVRYKFAFGQSDEEILTVQVEYNFKSLSIHIKDSYLINSKMLIQEFLNIIFQSPYFAQMRELGYNRSYSSLVSEWCAHNILYDLGYKRDQTKDADLDQNESWIRKLGYAILSIFYW